MRSEIIFSVSVEVRLIFARSVVKAMRMFIRYVMSLGLWYLAALWTFAWLVASYSGDTVGPQWALVGEVLAVLLVGRIGGVIWSGLRTDGGCYASVPVLLL